MFRHFPRDLQSAIHAVRSSPGVSLLVVVTLALGIAANGLFFASFYAWSFRPLPFEQPDGLVMLHQSRPAFGEERLAVSAKDLRDWAEASDVFSEVGAFVDVHYTVGGSHEPVHRLGAAVSSELFPLLGVEPSIGRLFRPEEARPGGPAVVLLGHALWVDRFARDPAIVGRTLEIDGAVHEVIGVMPEGFGFPYFGKLWTPLQLDTGAAPRDRLELSAIARLAEGRTSGDAAAVLSSVSRQTALEHPQTHAELMAQVLTLREAWMPSFGLGRLGWASQLILYLGLLAIICANVLNVMLAQAAARRRERAIYAALGASRLDLLRQSMMEALLLAGLGGLLGSLLAWRSDVWLAALLPMELPYWLDFRLGAVGFAYVGFVTLLAALAIGLLPAVRSSRESETLALTGSGGTRPRRRERLRRGVIVLEYAVAVVILVQGIVMTKSFQSLRAAERGFEAQGVTTVSVPLSGPAYEAPLEEPEQGAGARRSYVRRVLAGLSELSIVEVAAAADTLPYTQPVGPRMTGVFAEGSELAESEGLRAADHAVSSDFFAALSVPVLKGRTFTAAEVENGGEVVVVSRSVAEALWPAAEPLQRRVRLAAGAEAPWLQVIGVVEDIEPGQMIPGFGNMPRHRVYLPLAGTSGTGVPSQLSFVLLGAAEAPASDTSQVREALRAIDPTRPLIGLRTMEEVLDEFYFAQKFWSRLFTTVALLTLLIAGVGVHGVTRYAVSRRRHEMGVRLAVGATPARVVRRVLRQGATMAAVGSALGLLGAVPLVLAMQALVHEVDGRDPSLYLPVLGVLLALSLLASLTPALSAAKTDPARTLADD